MIQDPADELVGLVRRGGDDPEPADRRAAELLRRRFGLSLPLPFAAQPDEREEIPVRLAVGPDGPAIAATKWRSWRIAYRGILPDDFLAGLAVRPAPGYWMGLATLPPSKRHRLFVAGRPGVVVGVCELRPIRDPDLDPGVVEEVQVLYLDPLVRGRGVGTRLLGAAVDHVRSLGCDDVRLWVAAQNDAARAFYEATGWAPDGSMQWVDLGDGVGMDEVRYRYGW